MSPAFLDDGGPGDAPEPAVVASSVVRPALRRLVGDTDDFAATTWAHQPLLRSAVDPQGFTDLLSEGAVDELLSERGLRTPFLRVAKDGATTASSAFTAPGGVGAGVADQVSDDKLSALFAGGSTLVLQALHRVWPPVIDFCQQLAADLGHPVQANAYVTPPQSKGFDDHYDVHDVFVLQVAGRKKWSIHAPVLPSPLREQPWTDRRDAVRQAAEQAPLIEAVLEPGDVLYLPRGHLHSATALGGVSIHLTLGIHSWTRRAVAEELVALALEDLTADEQMRTSLSLGTTLAPDEIDAELVTSRLRDTLAAIDPDLVSQRLRRRRLGTQRAAPLGPLAQHALASSLEGATRLRLRDHLDAGVESGDLHSRAGTVTVAGVPPETLSRLLAGTSVTAAELGVDTARALVETGLVVAG